MPSSELPSFQDVLDACPRVYAHMRPSPLLRHPLLDDWTGAQTWVKHENHNPTGAFKVRGGLNLVAQLTEDERQRGVIAASTGNHGQSLALACGLHGVRCRIVVPVGNNPEKNAAIRALGAEVLERGRDFDEAREYVEMLVTREGWRYVHSANEPALLAGVGTTPGSWKPCCTADFRPELPVLPEVVPTLLRDYSVFGIIDSSSG